MIPAELTNTSADLSKLYRKHTIRQFSVSSEAFLSLNHKQSLFTVKIISSKAETSMPEYIHMRANENRLIIINN